MIPLAKLPKPDRQLCRRLALDAAVQIHMRRADQRSANEPLQSVLRDADRIFDWLVKDDVSRGDDRVAAEVAPVPD